MKKFNAATLEQVGPSVLMTPAGDPRERSYPAYIGLDVRKDTIEYPDCPIGGMRITRT